MQNSLVGCIAVLLAVTPALAQGPETIEVPLRVQDGLMLVTVDGPDGAEYDFVLGLGMTLITESAAARMGESASALTLGGIPVDTEQASSVPDEYMASSSTPARRHPWGNDAHEVRRSDRRAEPSPGPQAGRPDGDVGRYRADQSSEHVGVS